MVIITLCIIKGEFMNYYIDTGFENDTPYLRVCSKLNGYCLLDFYGAEFEKLIKQSVFQTDECYSSNEQVINNLIKKLFHYVSCRDSGSPLSDLQRRKEQQTSNYSYESMARSVRGLLNISYN